jgi:hypothetical protein
MKKRGLAGVVLIAVLFCLVSPAAAEPLRPTIPFTTEQDGLAGFKEGGENRQSPSIAAPVYQWHTFYGSAGHDTGTAIAIDKDGNIYVAGSSSATWQGDRGANPLHAHSGSYDFVVTKLDSSGAYQWHTFYGSNGDEFAYGIAVDEGGGVYVTGSSQAAWLGDGGGDPLHGFNGGDDITVLKLDGNGAYQWHTFYGSASYSDYGSGIATDANGGVVVSGGSAASWQGEGGIDPLHAHTGGIGDIMVLKLDSNGAYRWHTFYGSNDDDGSNGLAIDKSGNLYVTGQSYATWKGEGGAHPRHPYRKEADIVVLKLDGNGAYQWHTFFGSKKDEYGFGIAVDGDGNVYVAGESFTGWRGAGGRKPLHAHSGNVDITVLKLDSSGAYQWHAFYGGIGGNSGNGIATDRMGNAYVTGYSTASWQGRKRMNPLHAYSGRDDLVVLKLNTSGAYQWHTYYGSSIDDDTGGAVAVDQDGNVYVAGGSWATWQGDNGAAPLHDHGPAGNMDLTVLKMSGGGTTLEPSVSTGRINETSGEVDRLSHF